MADIHEAACCFYQLAERFCDAVEKKSVSVENAAEWLSLLMELYTKAMTLPEVEPDDEPISYEGNEIPQLAIECPSTYWEIYDPLRPDEPVCGDLKDDLQDIYRDLCSGIKAFYGRKCMQCHMGMEVRPEQSLGSACSGCHSSTA